jgi:hypothetical protein
MMNMLHNKDDRHRGPDPYGVRRPVGGVTTVGYPAGGARMGGGAPAGQRIGAPGATGAVPPWMMPMMGGAPSPALPPGVTELPGGGTAGNFREMDGQVFDEQDGWQMQPPQMMSRANGGPLPMPVARPTLVGEEGPELILPREDGRGFVLPADVTEQVLPMMQKPKGYRDGGTMMQRPKGYRDGGTMEKAELYTTPGFAIGSGSAAMVGPYGTGTSMRFPAESAGGRMAAMEVPRMMMDPRTGYQMDMDAPGMPLVPDVVQGPWAQPGMEMTAEQREALTRGTQGYAQNLMQRPGVVSATEAYESQLVPDQLVSEQGLDRVMTAQGSLQEPQMIPLREMRDRVRTRSDMNFQRREDERVRREMAAREARQAVDPLGGPSAAERSQMQMMGREQRQMERFMRTPEGMKLRMQQQAQQASAQAGQQWQPLNDPTTGRPVALVNGRGQTVSLPKMERDEQVLFRQKEVMDPIWGKTVVSEPFIFNWTTRTGRDMPFEGGESNALGNEPAGGAPAQQPPAAPGGQAVRVTSEEEYDKLPPGTRFIAADDPQQTVRVK